MPSLEDTFFITGGFQLMSSVFSSCGRCPTPTAKVCFLSSVYLKWPCPRSWAFLSLNVLISWIKLHSWSQSSGYSHRPRSVNLIASSIAGDSYSFTYSLVIQVVEGHFTVAPLTKKLKSKSDSNCFVAVFNCMIVMSLSIIQWSTLIPNLTFNLILCIPLCYL